MLLIFKVQKKKKAENWKLANAYHAEGFSIHLFRWSYEHDHHCRQIPIPEIILTLIIILFSQTTDSAGTPSLFFENFFLIFFRRFIRALSIISGRLVVVHWGYTADKIEVPLHSNYEDSYHKINNRLKYLILEHSYKKSVCYHSIILIYKNRWVTWGEGYWINRR